MKRILLSSLVLSTVCVAAMAQSVGVVIASASPLSAQNGPNLQQTNVPIGPVAPASSLIASVGASPGLSGSASAELSWSSDARPGSMRATIRATATIDSLLTAQASSGPHEFLLSFSNPTPVDVTLFLSTELEAPVGASVPVSTIDVGDDGTVDCQLLQPQVQLNTTIGPTPLLVRCRLAADSSADGFMQTAQQVVIRPASETWFLVQGCSNAIFDVAPRFDGNVDYSIDPTSAGSSVAVFGLEPQPLLLGTALPNQVPPPMPCILLPRRTCWCSCQMRSRRRW